MTLFIPRLYTEELRKAGKPLPRKNPCRIEIYCAKNRAAAMEMGAPYISEKYKAYAQWESDKAMPEHERIDKSFEELVQDRFVIGSPEDCWHQLKPYIDELGVTPLRVPHTLPRYARLQRLGQHAPDVGGVAAGLAQRHAHPAGEDHRCLTSG